MNTLKNAASVPYKSKESLTTFTQLHAKITQEEAFATTYKKIAEEWLKNAHDVFNSKSLHTSVPNKATTKIKLKDFKKYFGSDIINLAYISFNFINHSFKHPSITKKATEVREGTEPFFDAVNSFIQNTLELYKEDKSIFSPYKKTPVSLKNEPLHNPTKGFMPSNFGLSQALHALSHKNEYKEIDLLARSRTSQNGVVTLRAPNDVEDVLYYLERQTKLLSPVVRDTFHCILKKTCDIGMSKEVFFTYQEYLKMTGKADKGQNRAKFKEALSVLETTDIHITGVIKSSKNKEFLVKSRNILTYSEYFEQTKNNPTSRRLIGYNITLGDWVYIIREEVQKGLIKTFCSDALAIDDNKHPWASMFGDTLHSRYRI